MIKQNIMQAAQAGVPLSTQELEKRVQQALDLEYGGQNLNSLLPVGPDPIGSRPVLVSLYPNEDYAVFNFRGKTYIQYYNIGGAAEVELEGAPQEAVNSYVPVGKAK
ncbi:MAG: hypothetical protein KGN01_06255 [Patescibacteria group bacterium]|nr:hypothetical protein [Patescibacteria group bacterium]